MRQAKVLIIDEISMMGPVLLEVTVERESEEKRKKEFRKIFIQWKLNLLHLLPHILKSDHTIP